MNDEKNIFDLENLEDLPKDFRNLLILRGLREDSKRVLSLFNIKDQLSVAEVMVGMMRKYKKRKTREWVSSTLYNFKKYKMIKKVDGKRGVFKLIKPINY